MDWGDISDVHRQGDCCVFWQSYSSWTYRVKYRSRQWKIRPRFEARISSVELCSLNNTFVWKSVIVFEIGVSCHDSKQTAPWQLISLLLLLLLLFIYLQHAPLHHVILHALWYVHNIYNFALLFTVFPLLDLLHFVVVNWVCEIGKLF